MITPLKAEPVLNQRFDLGEGPTWTTDDGLTWVDIFPAAVITGRPTNQGLSVQLRFLLEGPVSGAIPRPSDKEGWLLVAGSGFSHLAVDGTVTQLVQPEAKERGRVRMND